MRVLDHARRPRRAAARPLLILTHSHLRWDFVWQRPQQLLSRFGSDRVVFVEEPSYADDVRSARLEISLARERVHRVIPVLPARLRTRYDDGMTAVRALLADALSPAGALADAVQETEAVVQWFYTPMPAPVMLRAFGESAVVYDCMDELSKFRFAPPELARRERWLLTQADVVFTGGHRLFESKSRLHPNVHFFGCGVDAPHFARARRHDTALPPDVASIAAPRLGYIGVIDERLDYALLGAIARAHPAWSLVMIGPLAKVTPAELPESPNLHWLGRRDYADLPRYMKAFDVCLMPFALNEATEYINPTKTLEYLAAGKPVVSTAVPDVVHHFASVVRVAGCADAFVAQCAAALRDEDDARIAAGIERAAQASWESIVARMRMLLTSAISARAGWPDRSGGAPEDASSPLVAAADSRDDVEGDPA